MIRDLDCIKEDEESNVNTWVALAVAVVVLAVLAYVLPDAGISMGQFIGSM